MKISTLLISILIILQSCHANPSEKITMEEKQIIKAVERNDINTITAAIKTGININMTDSQKRSLLLIATNNKHIEMAKLLVLHGADVNQQAKNKDSAFLYAGASGQTELVELFLNNGARFDLYNRYNGTALIPACERGHTETVRLLANTKNYPIDHINRLGWTALMEAVVLGNGNTTYQEIVQILKDAGAKMDIPDHDGLTPLQHAERRGYKEIANIIRR